MNAERSGGGGGGGRSKRMVPWAVPAGLYRVVRLRCLAFLVKSFRHHRQSRPSPAHMAGCKIATDHLLIHRLLSVAYWASGYRTALRKLKPLRFASPPMAPACSPSATA